MNDFRKFATGHLGMNGMVLDDVMKAQMQYLNPYILEERQLNVTQMDVFSRLMMDRIIFTTRCSSYLATWPQYVQVWLLRWLQYCSLPEQKASARLLHTAA